MNNVKMTSEQLEKVGNTLVYIATNIPNIGKTRMLKLIFLIEETVIKRSQVPFLGLPYYVWQFGPVQREIYKDLVSKQHPLFNKYISITQDNDGKSSHIKAKVDFCNDEFSDFEIEIMNEIIRKYGNWSGKELVEETHKEGTLWKNIVDKKNINFENKKHTNYIINFEKLLNKQERIKYRESIEMEKFAAHFKK